MIKADELYYVIGKQTAEYKELVTTLANARQKVQDLEQHYKPDLDGEKFYTGTQILKMFQITRRTLQDYRDK